MTRDRITIDVPTSEARRDHVEQHVFARLDAIRSAELVPANRDRVEQNVFSRLDAIRSVERNDVVVPTRSRSPWVPWVAVAGVAATAVIVVLAVRRDELPPTTAPSHVVTPIGGASRFTVGDAVIDAGSDTSVEVTTGSTGEITLALARGFVDCDVEPRADRSPFRVIAGDVSVEVVGTRFSVSRSATNVRVDVTRGVVLVRATGVERFVVAGETWSSAPTLTADATPAPKSNAPMPAAPVVDELVTLEPNPPPTKEPPTKEPVKPVVSSRSEFQTAQRLEARDKAAAARGYRKIANGHDKWSALALFSLAELEVSRGRADQALAVVGEYLRRFSRGANAEDAAWLRVEIHRTARKPEAARAAATDYLKRFPSGTYVKSARRLVDATP